MIRGIKTKNNYLYVEITGKKSVRGDKETKLKSSKPNTGFCFCFFPLCFSIWAPLNNARAFKFTQFAALVINTSWQPYLATQVAVFQLLAASPTWQDQDSRLISSILWSGQIRPPGIHKLNCQETRVSTTFPQTKSHMTSLAQRASLTEPDRVVWHGSPDHKSRKQTRMPVSASALTFKPFSFPLSSWPLSVFRLFLFLIFPSSFPLSWPSVSLPIWGCSLSASWAMWLSDECLPPQFWIPLFLASQAAPNAKFMPVL